MISQCRSFGCCVLPSAFNAADIENFRSTALANRDIMGQTRDNAHSYHLAGFHRFPMFSLLHARIASSEVINTFLSAYYSNMPYYAIGLSDITINRSQQWHTDLLRGQYSKFLDQEIAWRSSGGSCIKALVYLQDGTSLNIVQGSHLVPSPLDDVELDRLAQSQKVTALRVNAGDVVMMDVRMLHRGSTDEEMQRSELAQTPKILLSTVFGSIESAFTQAMQVGNAHRMADWDSRFLCKPQTRPK